MKGKLSGKLTYANVMATIAVFIALGGGAYATTRIDGGRLERRSVAGDKLERDTVTGKELKEAALGPVRFASLAKRADQAPVAGYRVVVKPATNSANSTTNAAATCPGDTEPIGGGAIAQDPDHQTVSTSAPNGVDWVVTMVNADSEPHSFEALAICGRVSQPLR
jgi:hypothetical protein